MIYCSKDGNCK